MSAKSGTETSRIRTLIDSFLVFFTSYFVYLLTIYPSVGTEDSGELITSAAALDIAHPPGYPLHTLLGKLFTILIPFGNIGWRVNLMSAFFGAAAVVVIYLIIKQLTRNSTLGISGALFLAFSDIFWSQSIRTETYTLHAFSLSAVLLLLLLWHQENSVDKNSNSKKSIPRNRYLFWSALVYGLGLGNQHQMLLAFPPVALFIAILTWQNLKPIKNHFKRFLKTFQKLAVCALLLLIGLITYAYLPIRTAIAPYDNPTYIKHDGLHTWETFSAFVNRNIYGGTIAIGGDSKSSGETQEAEASDPLEPIKELVVNIAQNNWNGFAPLAVELARQLLWVMPILFFLPGLFWLWKKRRAALFLIGGLLFFHTVIQLHFTGYSWNMNPFNEFGARPFLIPAIMFLLIISWTGIQQEIQNPLIFKPFCRNARKTSPNSVPIKRNLFKKFCQYSVPAILLLLPLAPLKENFTSNNESNNWIAYDFNRYVLESLPKNAHLLSIGRDNHTFPLYYLQKIEKIRQDVNVEIYYSRKSPETENFEKRQKGKANKPIFVDLLPHHYNTLSLSLYNFVYKYPSQIERIEKRDQAESSSSINGANPFTNTPPSSENLWPLRGIRQKMDYPNSKLKAIYYMKMAILNPKQQELWLSKIEEEAPFIEQFELAAQDWRTGSYNSGMF